MQTYNTWNEILIHNTDTITIMYIYMKIGKWWVKSEDNKILSIIYKLNYEELFTWNSIYKIKMICQIIHWKKYYSRIHYVLNTVNIW